MSIISQCCLLQLKNKYLGFPQNYFTQSRQLQWNSIASLFHYNNVRPNFRKKLEIKRAFWKAKKSYATVKPEMVTPILTVPDNIQRPPYAIPGAIQPGHATDIYFKQNESQISKLKQACQLARAVLDMVEKEIKVGMTTDEIDKLVHKMIIDHDAYPSPLLYRGFPKSCCTSVNNVACHGIPDTRKLENGDIVNVDVTVFLNGYHGDSSRTFLIGDVDKRGKELVEVAKTSLALAIAECHPGKKLNIIGKIISKTVADRGFSVVPEFCGHGIGENFHELPDIFHFENNEEMKMKEGMSFTIEPVISEGSDEIDILDDGWTAISVDGSRSAQFEHTILITKSGCEILT